MDSSSNVFLQRRRFTKERLRQLATHICEVNALSSLPQLCIYVTGSYGRLEASEYSDLDLFFIHQGTNRENAVPKLVKTCLDARLIELAECLGFPAFSNDGEYLTVHYIDDIRRALGSSEDDYRNYFTARLLLLLESRPVFNNHVYEIVIENTIASYYRDYHDHETSFRPIFLINDIIRFWKTICLNYEHKRNRPENSKDRRDRNHLKNLKLKYSRMLTCFSAVLLLARNRAIVTPSWLAAMVHLSPLDRLDQAAQSIPNAQQLTSRIKTNYAWFLEVTGKDEQTVLNWISHRQIRNDAFDRARKFGSDMYALLVKGTENTDTLRFVVL